MRPDPVALDDPADLHAPLLAALSALLALNLFMAVAGLVGTVPSPPQDKLPFIATGIALVVAALVLAQARHAAGPVLAALAALLELPAVGPQKFLTELHAAHLAPVIVLGSLAVAATWWAAWQVWRGGRSAAGAKG